MDIIFTRYHDLSFIREMDVEWVIDLFIKAISKHYENQQWEFYLHVQAPRMDGTNFLSFNEWKEQLQQKQLAEYKIKNKVETVQETYNRILGIE